MEIVPNLTRKAKKDISSYLVDRETLETDSSFPCEGGLDYALIDVGPSSHYRVFPPNGDKRICSDYDICIIPFHEYLFSLMGFCLPFTNFNISVMNHLMISPSKLYLVC